MGRGRGSAQRPTREIVQRYYRITAVERLSQAIAAVQQGYGWQLQVTNAPVARLNLGQATGHLIGGTGIMNGLRHSFVIPFGKTPVQILS